MIKMILRCGMSFGLLTAVTLLMSGCINVETPTTAPVTKAPVTNNEAPAPVDQENEAAVVATAGWITYTNTDYSYSIKYPFKWTVDLKANDSRGKALPTFLAPGQNNAPHDKIVDISVAPTADVVKPDSAAYIQRNGNHVISKSPVVVGGVSTDLFITDLNNGYEMMVYVEKGSETYHLALRSATSGDTEFIDTFKAMVSSFVFTNPTASAINLKAYTGSVFSLRYPSYWTVKEKVWTKINDSDTGVRTTVTFSNGADPYPDALIIDSGLNTGGSTLEEMVQQGSGNTKIGETSIGGYTFYKIAVSQYNVGSSSYIGIVGKNTVYIDSRMSENEKLSGGDQATVFSTITL